MSVVASPLFDAAKPNLGPQPWSVGSAAVWILPSSSGANNAVPYSEKLAAWQQLANHLHSDVALGTPGRLVGRDLT